jgi:ABC-type branched-subunit amino acid transport system substrate-binding protein
MAGSVVMVGHVRKLASALALFSLFACGPKRVVVNGVEMTYEEGAAKVYGEGKAAKDKGDVATAKVRFKEVVNLFEDSSKVPDALGELGSLLIEEGGCKAGRGYLERLAEKYPLHPRAAAAKQTLQKCESGAVEEAGKAPVENAALATINKQFQGAASDTERKDLAAKGAEAAITAGDFGTAVRWLLKVLSLESSDGPKNTLKQQITDLIDTRVSFQDVRQLLEEIPGNDFPKSVLTYKLGRIQYHVRDLDNASETLKKYLSTWPGAPNEAGAKKLLALISARSNVKPKIVGVVLPLSGKLRGYGENALQAVQLAFELGESKKSPSGINLVVKDTKGERATAAQAVQDLALEDGAVAIVGPMFTSEALAASYKAEELGIPILTISAAEEIGTIGPYVFRNGLTSQMQAQALVEYSMNVAGLKNFAILYPRVPYGETFTQLFWDEIDKRKGEVRGVESYTTEDTTFAPQVKSLVARDVMGMRSDFRKAYEECDKTAPDNFRRQKCREAVAQNLKPIIDFDALFIPDYEKTVALVSAALAFEDIIVETDPKMLKRIEKTLDRKVTPVQLLGGNGWNSQDLVNNAKRNVENAIFTDAFFAQSQDANTQQFVQAYQKKYNRTPRTEEALLYDSARIIRQVIEKDQPQTRDALREALRHVSVYPGVTGKTSFSAGPDAQKEIRLLTITNGAIKEVGISDLGGKARPKDGKDGKDAGDANEAKDTKDGKDGKRAKSGAGGTQ